MPGAYTQATYSQLINAVCMRNVINERKRATAFEYIHSTHNQLTHKELVLISAVQANNLVSPI